MAILGTMPALLGLFSIITLFGYDLAKSRKTQDQNRSMVPKGSPDLQRCHCGGARRNMGASDFFHVAAAPRPYRHSAAYAKRAQLRRLDSPKSSLGSIQPLFYNRVSPPSSQQGGQMFSMAHITKPKQQVFPLWTIPIQPTPNGSRLSKSSQYQQCAAYRQHVAMVSKVRKVFEWFRHRKGHRSEQLEGAIDDANGLIAQVCYR
jgi:hypothetical protein